MSSIRRKGKDVNEEPDPPRDSAAVDHFCVIVAREEDGSPYFVQVFTGETWEEADAKVCAQIYATFFEERANVAIIDIYRVTDQGIEWFDYREGPEYMRIYRQIRTLCRKHLIPGKYHLSQPEEGKFTLRVKRSPGNSMLFELITLDEAALNAVQRYLQDRS